jgi:hypothetical protein
MNGQSSLNEWSIISQFLRGAKPKTLHTRSGNKLDLSLLINEGLVWTAVNSEIAHYGEH